MAGPVVRGRFGIRTRFAMVVLAVFIAAASALLVTEYLVVSVLFDTAISAQVLVIPADSPEMTGGFSTWEFGSAPGSAESPMLVSVVTDAQNATRDGVLGGLIPWSALTLAVFSVLGSAVAWWLAGRPLRRIREVTALAQTISGRDLGDRLMLGGPHDEIRALGDTFDEMLARLASAFDAQALFVANASHELRTPLAISRTSLEVALRRPNLPDPVRTGLGRALRANQRSETVLEALLTLAGLRTPVPLVPRPLSPLLDAEVTSQSGHARRRNITMACACPDDVVALIDETLFGLLLSNLVSNALLHNADGGHVALSCEQTGEVVTLVVANTGPVLDEPVNDLLKPFHRGVSTRLSSSAVPGSGLGLAIAQSVAAALGGMIALEAGGGGGLVVRVTLRAPSV